MNICKITFAAVIILLTVSTVSAMIANANNVQRWSWFLGQETEIHKWETALD